MEIPPTETVDVTADEVVAGAGAAAVGDDIGVDAGGLNEDLRGDVGGRKSLRRGDGDGAGRGARIVDQILRGVEAVIVDADHQAVRVGVDVADPGDVIHGVGRILERKHTEHRLGQAADHAELVFIKTAEIVERHEVGVAGILVDILEGGAERILPLIGEGTGDNIETTAGRRGNIVVEQVGRVDNSFAGRIPVRGLGAGVVSLLPQPARASSMTALRSRARNRDVRFITILPFDLFDYIKWWT